VAPDLLHSIRDQIRLAHRRPGPLRRGYSDEEVLATVVLLHGPRIANGLLLCGSHRELGQEWERELRRGRLSYSEDDGGPGGVDFMNEVYVGRIPVYSRSRTGSRRSPLAFPFGFCIDEDYQLRDVDEHGVEEECPPAMSFSDVDTDGAYLSEAMISNYLSPAGMNSYRMYMQGSFCGDAANSVFSSNEELVDGATKAKWSSNPYGLVWWWGTESTSMLNRVWHMRCG